MTIERPMLPPTADSVHAFSHQLPSRQPESETLTSESRKPTQGLSRRLVLAGLAVLPAVPLPVAAVEPDPIYAAIEACREARKIADQAFGRVSDLHREAKQRLGSGEEQYRERQDYVESFIGDEDEYTDGPAVALWDSYEDFVNTVPTTLASLFAMLIYAEEVETREPDLVQEMLSVSTLATAAKSLSKGGAA
jgi:hypothetical protein